MLRLSIAQYAVLYGFYPQYIIRARPARIEPIFNTCSVKVDFLSAYLNVG